MSVVCCVVCVFIAVYMICRVLSIGLVAVYNHRRSAKDLANLKLGAGVQHLKSMVL